jgi:hypothetical protein
LQEERIIIPVAKQKDEVSPRPNATNSYNPMAYVRYVIPAEHVSAFRRQRFRVVGEAVDYLFTSFVVNGSKNGWILPQRPSPFRSAFRGLVEEPRIRVLHGSLNRLVQNRLGLSVHFFERISTSWIRVQIPNVQ